LSASVPNFEKDLRALLDRLEIQGANFVSEPNWTRVELPKPPGADYQFDVFVCRHGEHSIAARLTAPGQESPFFWFMPFELADFHRVPQELNDSVLAALELLATHETKILQRRGWFLWHFDCFYRSGRGELLYSLSVLRGLMNVPNAGGGWREFSSPALTKVPSVVKHLTSPPGRWMILSRPRPARSINP
jgi:hypothetical protein